MIYVILSVQFILELFVIIVSAICIVVIMIFVEEQYENWKQKKQER